MKPNCRNFIILFAILLFLFSSGCRISTKKTELELKIAAASDLRLAFTEIGELFEHETGVKVIFSFGSTGQLSAQIENGAPFDVFAAANIAFVNRLKEVDLIIPETQTTYAFGRIGLSSLLGSPLTINSFEDLLNPAVKKIAIANPEHAPYGLAAKQALETAGIYDYIKEKLVYGQNISDTLSFIETGNAEAGIIALSLFSEGEVNFNIIDENMHEPLEQSIAVLSRTKQADLAKEFINFIMGPIGKPIMESYGFIVPGGK